MILYHARIPALRFKAIFCQSINKQNKIIIILRLQMKSVKNIQSSPQLVSSKASKASMINIINSLGQSPTPKVNTMKILHKELAALKKYSSLAYNRKCSENKEIDSDFVRKIMFENQQQARKIKLLEEKNTCLEMVVKHVEERYREMKNYVLQLRAKYESSALESLRNIEQSPCQLKSSDAEVFKMFIKGMDNENEERNANKFRKQDRVSKQKSLKSYKPRIQENVEIIENGFIVNQPLTKKIFTYKKSVSMQAETGEAETQTDENVPSCSFDDSMKRSLELEGREVELISKLLHYESVIKDLEKVNRDITTKYDRIKSIIGHPRNY